MKCAVVVPVGSGHELYALDAEDSVELARATACGPFAEIAVFKVAVTLGKSGRSAARDEGVQLASRAGADWIFFLDAQDVLCPNVFANAAGCLNRYDAIWGSIHELADDDESGVPRPGQLLEITRIDQLLANDPVNTLETGHFVRTEAALATSFDPGLDSGEDFAYYLRLWSQFKCAKIAQPFSYNRRLACVAGSRAAVERVICEKCAELGFHADFVLRGEKFRFYVGNPFDLIHRSFLKGRFFEADELAYVESWVGQGAAIVEVGAYVGNHVVYYARFMQPRGIFVLEPNPEAAVLLRRNLEANAVTIADLSRLGIGAAETPANYDIVCESADNRGATRLVAAPAGSVRSAPLDDLIVGRVDFVKIDVEGMELDVLAGAKRVIAESRPKIMIEVMRQKIPHFEKWLDQNRYRVRHRFEYVYAVNFMVERADG